MKLILTLMDQGGGFMSWNEEEICGTLRSQMDGHPPIVVLEDDDTDGEEIFRVARG